MLSNCSPIVFNPEAEPSPLLLAGEFVQFRAIADFIAEDATFLSLRTGDLIAAVSSNPSESYWIGISNGRVGRFPRDMVELATKKQRRGLMREGTALITLLSKPTEKTGPLGAVVFCIRFVRGKDMSICDPWGTSDPFCTIANVNTLSGRPIKTKIISRTLNPEWNQAFEFANTDPFTLRVSIWDHDLVGSDDSMGFVDIISKDWLDDSSHDEVVKWLDVVDGDGQIQIGLSRVRK